MDKASPPLRAYGSKKQAVVVIAALAPMLTGMSWTLVVNSTYPLVARLFFASILCVFALVLIGPVHRLLTRGPVLEVSNSGFRWRGWSAETISWNAVERWKPKTYLGTRYITVWLHEPQRHRATTAARWTQRVNDWFGHGDISISSGGLNISFDDLAAAFRRFGPMTLLPDDPGPSGPKPVAVQLVNEPANPIHLLLKDWNLPLTESRAEVSARVGVSLDPVYQWEALVLREAVSMPGAMQPWTASALDRIPPQFPIARYSGIVWFENDAKRNLERTAEFLAASLGPTEIGRQWNTLIAKWQSGRAEISLIAWPPEWQSDRLVNPAEERDKRLRTACYVHVTTGFCLPLSGEERVRVTGFKPFQFDGEVGSARMPVAGTTAPHETELEYVRDPEDILGDLRPSLGMSADAQALIVVSNQLFVIPRDTVLRLEVTRLTPAKGSGGATLYAICRTQAPGLDGQSVFLAQHSKPDGLNAFAHDLGRQLGCRVDIGPYYPDC